MEINNSEQFFDVMSDLLVDSKISRDEYYAIADYVRPAPDGRRRRKWTMKDSRVKLVQIKKAAMDGILPTAVFCVFCSAVVIAKSVTRGTFEMEE